MCLNEIYFLKFVFLVIWIKVKIKNNNKQVRKDNNKIKYNFWMIINKKKSN